MEEKKAGGHRLLLTDREEGIVYGVLDVVSFDENQIVMETPCGRMTVRGQQLHVSQISLEKGEASLSGKIDSLAYSGKEKQDSSQSLLKKLFQ